MAEVNLISLQVVFETELALPDELRGRCLFSKWELGSDLPFAKANVPNVVRKIKLRRNNSDTSVLVFRTNDKFSFKRVI